jgi:hypothetical protein
MSQVADRRFTGSVSVGSLKPTGGRVSGYKRLTVAISVKRGERYRARSLVRKLHRQADRLRVIRNDISTYNHQ